MSSKQGRGLVWGVVGVGAGCAFLVVASAALGAVLWLSGRPAETPFERAARESAMREPDAGPPPCPSSLDEDGEGRTFLYANLESLQFVLASTAGERYEMPYEGTQYPFAVLQEQLRERRYAEPNRRDLFVVTEPGIPDGVAERVIREAGAVGFTEAMRCRTGEDPLAALARGDAPGTEDGFGGLGLRGSSDVPDDGTIGLGNLGTIGDEGSGYGRGAGRLSGRDVSPRVREGAPQVRGALSSESVRRVVRRHLNEVRFCYEQELHRRPELAGRVVMSFIIAPNGSVQTAAIATSTIENARVESCLTQAVRRWTFPEPDGGGIVGVNYTFEFSSRLED